MLSRYLQGLARDAIERTGRDGLLSLAVDPELAQELHPLDQAEDVGWCRRLARIPQPGEPRYGHLWCDPEQPIETLPRFIRQAGRERPMQQPFAACTGSMAKNVDCSRCRQQDVSRSRLIDDGLHQPLRARGARGQRHGKSQQLAVGIGVEGAATEALHQLGDMLPAICRTLPIGHELRGRHTDLVGDESQHRCGRCLGGIEHTARKAHAAHEHGKPEPIGRRPLLGDEVEIGPAQRVMPRDRPLVGCPRPQRRELLVGEKTAARHRLSFSNFAILQRTRATNNESKRNRPDIAILWPEFFQCSRCRTLRALSCSDPRLAVPLRSYS